MNSDESEWIFYVQVQSFQGDQDVVLKELKEDMGQDSRPRWPSFLFSCLPASPLFLSVFTRRNPETLNSTPPPHPKIKI